MSIKVFQSFNLGSWVEPFYYFHSGFSPMSSPLRMDLTMLVILKVLPNLLLGLG